MDSQGFWLLGTYYGVLQTWVCSIWKGFLALDR